MAVLGSSGLAGEFIGLARLGRGIARRGLPALKTAHRKPWRLQKAAGAISRESKHYQRRQLLYMEQFEETFK